MEAKGSESGLNEKPANAELGLCLPLDELSPMADQVSPDEQTVLMQQAARMLSDDAAAGFLWLAWTQLMKASCWRYESVLAWCSKNQTRSPARFLRTWPTGSGSTG